MMIMCDRQVTSATVIQSVQAKMAKWLQQQKKSNDIAVPVSMKLKPHMIQSNLRDAILVQVQIDSILRVVQEGDITRGQQVIQKHSGSLGSIAFVVRKPGCPFCREQALSLITLATLYPQYFEGFDIFGIIKEVGSGSSTTMLMKDIIELQEKYLRNVPLYCDKAYAFYHALGDRKVGWNVLLRPSVLYVAFCDGVNRMKNKGASAEDEEAGEGLIQGGLIIFGSDGKPKYAYEEETGLDLVITDIVAALEAMRKSST